jgi:hypothetical protein
MFADEYMGGLLHVEGGIHYRWWCKIMHNRERLGVIGMFMQSAVTLVYFFCSLATDILVSQDVAMLDSQSIEAVLFQHFRDERSVYGASPISLVFRALFVQENFVIYANQILLVEESFPDCCLFPFYGV